MATSLDYDATAVTRATQLVTARHNSDAAAFSAVITAATGDSSTGKLFAAVAALADALATGDAAAEVLRREGRFGGLGGPVDVAGQITARAAQL